MDFPHARINSNKAVIPDISKPYTFRGIHMPIIISSPLFTEPTAVLPIEFKALNTVGDPVASTNFTVSRQLITMPFANPNEYVSSRTGQTDADGKGRAEFYAALPNGTFNIIKIVAGNSVDIFPAGAYSTGLSSNVIIDGSSLEEGNIVVEQDDIVTKGLKIKVTLPKVAAQNDLVFLAIGTYYIPHIMDEVSNTVTFRLPAGLSGAHPIGERATIIYGTVDYAGNCIVPMTSTLVVRGAVPVIQMLAPAVAIQADVNSTTINIVNNALGITITIPENQSIVKEGDKYQFFYTLNEGEEVVTNLGEEKTVPALPSVLKYTTEPNALPARDNVTINFWYKITNSDGVAYFSAPATRILATA